MTTPAQPSLSRSQWLINPASATAQFSIRKRLLFLRTLTVTGRFGGVSGALQLDEAQPANSSVTATIQANTVDTGNARRDTKLRGPAFFDVDQFATIDFQSHTVTPIDPPTGHYRLTGNLTVRGISRQVDLDTYLDQTGDPSSGPVRFTGATTFNRRDFGMTWDSALIKIYDDVTVTLTLEAIRQ